MTESAPKRFKILLGGIVVFAVLVIAARILFSFLPPHSIEVGTKTYSVEWATTNTQRNRGLSNRASLPENHGMVFLFDRNDEHCFWMKDVHFALDIIWLNDRKQVTSMYQNVEPETYPQSFCSNEDGRFGIELPAGSIEQSGLQVGDPVYF